MSLGLIWKTRALVRIWFWYWIAGFVFWVWGLRGVDLRLGCAYILYSVVYLMVAFKIVLFYYGLTARFVTFTDVLLSNELMNPLTYGYL